MKKLLALVLVVLTVASVFGCAAPAATTAPAAEAKTEAAPAKEEAAPAAEAKAEAAPAADAPTYTFKLCDTQPDTSVLIQVAKIFGDKLNEFSGGRMTLEIYPSSQLGNATTCTQMLQTGDLTFFRNDAAAVYDFGVESHQVVSLPYLFKDSESCYEIMSGEIGDQLKQDVLDANLGFQTLGYIADTNRNFFTAKTPITQFSDMKGLKIRSLEASIYVDYKSSLGMNPTPMAFSDVYTSLSTGVIDAAANTLDSFVSNKFYEVCKYYILNNGMVPVYEMLVSSAVMDKLSAEDQEIVKNAWNEASAQYLPIAREKQAEQQKFCEEKGVTFCTPTDEDVWADACAWMFEKYGAGYEDMIAAIQNYSK